MKPTITVLFVAAFLIVSCTQQQEQQQQDPQTDTQTFNTGDSAVSGNTGVLRDSNNISPTDSAADAADSTVISN